MPVLVGDAAVLYRVVRQTLMQPLNRQLAVAPMLDWTDRHCRYFLGY